MQRFEQRLHGFKRMHDLFLNHLVTSLPLQFFFAENELNCPDGNLDFFSFKSGLGDVINETVKSMRFFKG